MVIDKFMKNLYYDNFDNIIDYMNYYVINELKYFILYSDLIFENHMSAINNINEYMIKCYRMQYMINKIDYDLNNIKGYKIKTLWYHNMILINLNMFYDSFEIIEKKIKKI